MLTFTFWQELGSRSKNSEHFLATVAKRTTLTKQRGINYKKDEYIWDDIKLFAEEFVNQHLAPERAMLAMNSPCLDAQLSCGSDTRSLH